jgi:hypothetical protein
MRDDVSAGASKGSAIYVSKAGRKLPFMHSMNRLFQKKFPEDWRAFEQGALDTKIVHPLKRT